ncbi:MAG: ATP-binding protein [Gammaproteobacteria bacterium]|nr:ATP-binding protein [Gammaproteobacteria bacterium]MCY4200812.1 ATP-binding protein [Gammaproteobacteria bacterium]MCY4278908.1 ATP-binding protein [Gammaproteobacteria bacterium]
MTFNRELAEALKFDDRDVAPFFAGRHAEIESFQNALAAAREKPQAVFRIYQGAPGCGKTSLANHFATELAKDTAENAIFVRFSESDDFSKEGLAVAIRDALVTANKPAEIAKEVTEFALSLMGRSRVADMLKKERVRRMPRSIEIVIHIDEAHSMGDQFNDFIKVLHAHGVGCPCVAVFTGLGQTAGRIREIKGMSRLSEEAVVNMGAMEREECIESTLNMLGRVGAAGDHEDAASRIATLAFGWPRHLNRAQKALRDELLRDSVDGDLSQADFARITQQSEQSRTNYYLSRIEDSLLAQDEEMTIRMINALREIGSVQKIRELGSVCKRVIERHGMSGDFPFDPQQGLPFAERLVESGVVVKTNSGFEIAIPSMADWAQAQCCKYDLREHVNSSISEGGAVFKQPVTLGAENDHLSVAARQLGTVISPRFDAPHRLVRVALDRTRVER